LTVSPSYWNKNQHQIYGVVFIQSMDLVIKPNKKLMI
jgi:hypothetical protein